MITDAPVVPVGPDFIAHLESRLWREFSAAAEDWSHCVSALTTWEDEHLLDNPSAELLARHKHTIERLLRFGQLLARATAQPEASGETLAEIVAATQHSLEDKLALWHGPKLSDERRAAILQGCFNES
jgi:hypothetical protein